MKDEVRRAVRLSRVPGVTIAEAARATGVSESAIRRARRDRSIALTREDLIIAALTNNGTKSEGTLDDAELASIAAWVDYANHDGTTANGLRADLADLAAKGQIALEPGRFRLLVPWP